MKKILSALVAFAFLSTNFAFAADEVKKATDSTTQTAKKAGADAAKAVAK
jgi:Ni/Co efflux regulator RcnB